MSSRDLEFTRPDGLVIRGRLYLPDGAAEGEKFPTAVFVHGLGGNYREIAHHGVGMAEEGIAAFLPDFCGGGPESISDGDTEKMTVRSECLDLETILSGLEAMPFTDTSNIFLMGESLGGLVAALVAAKRRSEVKGLILWYPAFDMPGDIREKLPVLPDGPREYYGMVLGREYYASAKEIDAYGESSGYTGPVLIIHGDRDDTVPIEGSHEALRHYSDASMIVIEGGGHGFDGDDSRHAREYSVDFMKSHLA